ncbi:hypothetical protein GN958_ATG20798, partial [Phytophthora infestans]
MKTFTASKSHLMSCTSCAAAISQLMRYSLLSCACKQCIAVAILQVWLKWQETHVLEANMLTLYALFDGKSAQEAHHFTHFIEAFINDMTRANVAPLRILTCNVPAAFFSGGESKHKAFTFTHTTNSGGNPVVSDGSDDRPFVIGVTTKAVLSSADQSSDTIILLINATYKLAQAGYPVIVCASLTLEEQHYTEALMGLP